LKHFNVTALTTEQRQSQKYFLSVKFLKVRLYIFPNCVNYTIFAAISFSCSATHSLYFKRKWWLLQQKDLCDWKTYAFNSTSL